MARNGQPKLFPDPLVKLRMTRHQDDLAYAIKQFAIAIPELEILMEMA